MNVDINHRFFDIADVFAMARLSFIGIGIHLVNCTASCERSRRIIENFPSSSIRSRIRGNVPCGTIAMAAFAGKIVLSHLKLQASFA